MINDPLLIGTNLQPVLDRLNVVSRRGRKTSAHTYIPAVLPVALVDAGQVTLTAVTSSQTLGTPATAGETTAPLINTRLADTGALAAGAWNVTVLVGIRGSVGTADQDNFQLKRFQSDNVTVVWQIPISVLGGGWYVMRITLAANERLVVQNPVAGTAGVVYQSSIWTSGPF